MKKWILSLLMAAPLMFSTAAQASIVYNWSGNCTNLGPFNCMGQATGVLTLADSFDGSTGNQSSAFESWSFQSSSASWGTSGPALFLWGGPQAFSVGSANGSFGTIFGGWAAVSGGFGNGSVATQAVPAPFSLALLGIGLLALGLMRRRRS